MTIVLRLSLTYVNGFSHFGSGEFVSDAGKVGEYEVECVHLGLPQAGDLRRVFVVTSG
jgi:hypothetical protein